MQKIYDIGLNTRRPFINARDYLDSHFLDKQPLKDREIYPRMEVPVTEYRSRDLKIRLIGDVLVDRRFIEIEGESKSIVEMVKKLRRNKVRMKEVK